MYRKLIFLSFIPLSYSFLRNVTIDDDLGDPLTGQWVLYTPESVWRRATNCSHCAARPNPYQAYSNTYHEGIFIPQSASNDLLNDGLNATVQFKGSFVAVFCILSESTAPPTGYSDMTFYVDSDLRGTFTHTPSGQNTFLYNVPVFSASGLSNTEHTLTIQNGHHGRLNSLLILDYITYSYNVDDPRTESLAQTTPVSQTTKRAAIIGAVLGFVSLLVLILLVLLVCRRKRKHRVKEVTLQPRERTHESLLLDTSSADINTINLSQRQITRNSKPTDRDTCFNPALLVRQQSQAASPTLDTRHNIACSTLQYDRQQAQPGLGHTTPFSDIPREPGYSQYSQHSDLILRWQRQTLEEARGATVLPEEIPLVIPARTYTSSWASRVHPDEWDKPS